MFIRCAAVLAAISLAACGGLSADTVLLNGKIFTSNPAQPWAQAVAIRGDRVIAVGDGSTVAPLIKPATRQIDLGGRTVVPGFNDAHQHIPIFPPSDHLTLPFDPTLSQIEEALRAQLKATPAGKIMQGEFGAAAWDQPSFTRDWLDGIAPNHPVWLTAFTGHGVLLNSA